MFDSYETLTTVTARFSRVTYQEQTPVTVLSALLHDGVCLVRFPGGEEAWVAAWRLSDPPERVCESGRVAEVTR